MDESLRKDGSLQKGKKLVVWSLKEKEKGMLDKKDGLDSSKMGKYVHNWVVTCIRKVFWFDTYLRMSCFPLFTCSNLPSKK